MLSEKYLNERSDILSKLHERERVLGNLGFKFDNLKKRYSTEYYDNLLLPISNLIHKNYYFPYLLRSYYFSDKFSLIINVFGIKMEEEVKKLGDLIHNLDLSNENQIMAFHNLEINEIYEKSILSVSRFTLNRRSKLIYDFRSTSTLYYDVVLPFHDKNYDPSSTDCTRTQDLPKFFTDPS